MASHTDCAAAKSKHDRRVLLPFTTDTLCIPDVLAKEIGTMEALIIGPTSGKAKPSHVEVSSDRDGAFLGRGWPQFARACGVAAGWLLVLRHRGRGVLTVKAFDASSCLLEPGAQPPEAAVKGEIPKDADWNSKPQFVRVLPTDFMEKLVFPPEFVKRYIPNHHQNSVTATVFGPHGNVSHIELEKNGSDLFFVEASWSQFIQFHKITKANALLVKYDGNMLFRVIVFNSDGYQKECKHKEPIAQQGIENQEQQEENSSNGKKKPRGLVTSSNEGPLWTRSVYNIGQIGSPSFMRKQINANTLRELAVAKRFCDAIGLKGQPCTVTLKTAMNNTKKSWPVQAHPCKNMSYRLGHGWRRFCMENSLELGDICTFKVMETTLWHVTAPCKETRNHLSYETPSASSRKHKTMNSESSNKGQKRAKASMISLNKASARGCVFEMGPPACIKKEINSTAFQNRLYLPLAFCNAIGIRESCMITLKTSKGGERSWQARVAPYDGSSHHVSGPGWTRFCRENRIKMGDVCTINISETKVWRVDISSSK